MAYSEFRQWAAEQGYKRDSLPAINGFTRRVRANLTGVEYHRTKKKRLFLGVETRVAEEDREDTQSEARTEAEG
jgi:hypothetical protein